MPETHDHERRFGGLSRLYGTEDAARIQSAHVAVVGVGGVGSWAVEALARSAVGRITLIDLDMVAESNTNRQIQALGDEYGKAKVDALAERVRQINPGCQIFCIEDFVTPQNVASLLTSDMDVVIDAIDQVRVKAAMIAHCRQMKIAIVTAGAAGGQTDPTQIQRDDLTRTIQDPLLAKVRSTLRKEYGFPKAPKKFGITAIYSTEPLRYPTSSCSTTTAAGLNCAGFGSSVCVTAPMGFASAAAAFEILLNQG